MGNSRKKIIVVDDNPANLTACKNTLKGVYAVYSAPSAMKMFELLDHFIPDLIMLDVEMPVLSGYEAARILKNNEKFTDIPIIFLTSKSDASSEIEGLNIGALDYIHKPFVGSLLIQRIEKHLALIDFQKDLRVQNESTQRLLDLKTREVWRLQNAVLNIVADLIECRDDVTGGHLSRTQMFLSILIDKLLEQGIYADEVSKWDMDFLLPSSQLHDLGKIGISDAILNKPGKLTAGEFEVMKRHVIIGVDAIKRMEKATLNHDFFRHAKFFAGSHHERWDGRGYPEGLAGEKIPMEGRLMAIVDVYDALVSVRPYKPAIPPWKSASIIAGERGKHFDPKLVDVFSSVSDKFSDIVNDTID